MRLFITFEGGEGCGKSLQSKNLYRRLLKQNLPVVLIHEPGGTPLGEKIRRLLKRSNGTAISALSELLLFNASRSQIVSDVILPNLTQEKIVICDRFSDSTVAYQSYARGLDLDSVEKINDIASQGLKPDLTFLLDAPPEIGLSRKKPGANDRFEQEKVNFHLKVREGFLKIARQSPKRWIVIDATLPPNTIGNIIWTRVAQDIKKA